MKVEAHSYYYVRNGNRVSGHALLFDAPGDKVVNHFEQRLPSGEKLIGHSVFSSWRAARKMLWKQGTPRSRPVDRALTAPDVRIIDNAWRVHRIVDGSLRRARRARRH